jgi:hypothetical protein
MSLSAQMSSTPSSLRNLPFPPPKGSRLIPCSTSLARLKRKRGSARDAQSQSLCVRIKLFLVDEANDNARLQMVGDGA